MASHRFHLQYVLVGRTGGIISGPSKTREYLDSQVQYYTNSEVAPIYIHSKTMDDNSESEIPDGILALEGATNEEAAALWSILDEVAGDSATRSTTVFIGAMMAAMNAMGLSKEVVEELVTRMTMAAMNAAGPTENCQHDS